MIKTTDTRNKTVEFTYVNRVVRVEKRKEERNHSDTLDYSDWRTTECTLALVYTGRVAREDSWIDHRHYAAGTELPIEKRFFWLDCTNIFAWRNESVREAFVDDPNTWEPEMHIDLQAWERLQEEKKIAQEKAAAVQRARDEEIAKEKERNNPTLGKRMTVVRGKKVPIGTEGVVAYVKGDSVLLKDGANWRDRKADGVWVHRAYLKAC